MAETRTPRLGIPQWSAGTDSPSRADFNEAFLDTDNLVAIDIEGTLAARPAASIRGRYYYASDTEEVYRDTGSAWKSVGKAVSDQVVRAGAAANVAQTVRGFTSQTADLTQWQTSASAVLARVDKDGKHYTTGQQIGPSAAGPGGVRGVTGTATGTVVDIVRGAAGQTADLEQWQNSAAAILAKIDKDGYFTAPKYSLSSGVELDTIEVYSFYNVGSLATATGKHELPLMVGYTLVGIAARLGTAPSGAPAIIDINKNGATIFGTQSARPTFADGSKTAVVGGATVTTFAANDYITLDIDAVGTTTAGSDLVLVMRLRRTT